MTETNPLEAEFEAHRDHLRAVAFRMLGSASEAEDALQESWLRLSRGDADSIENPGGWLTTVVGRVCLDMLRSRKSRREQPLVSVPEPLVTREEAPDPEHEVLLADSVGLALFVVMEALSPGERLAFVLHDMFGIPFEEIAPIVDRSPAATRKLASRARQRVRGQPLEPDVGLAAQREVVDAFVAASREGDFEALVRVLDPEVILRADAGPLQPMLSTEIQGAERVASQAMRFAPLADYGRPVVVNGVAGVLVVRDGRPMSLGAFTVRGGRIAEIDILADTSRLQEIVAELDWA
jgi:RNA polymerase sigma factor (sigma-70 family)